MKKCLKCGRMNSNQAKFCRYCGAKLPTDTPNHSKVTKSVIKKCPNCGTQNNYKAKFCKHCGHKFKKTLKTSNQSKHISHQYHPQHLAHKTQHTTKPTKHTNLQFKLKYNSQGNKPRINSTDVNNYFNWFKQTLLYPTKQHSAQSWFGVVSLFIMAILIWLACILSTSNEEVGNELGSLVVKYLPLKVMVANTGYAQTPFGYLLLSILLIACPVIIGFICKYVILKQHQTFMQYCNHFASYLNFGLILALLLVIFTVINQATLVCIFTILITFMINLTMLATVSFSCHKGREPADFL